MSDIVYVPAEGDCYHSREDCEHLEGGHRGSESQGNMVHEVRKAPLAEAKASNKKPCAFCV